MMLRRQTPKRRVVFRECDGQYGSIRGNLGKCGRWREAQNRLQITTALDVAMRHLFSGEPGRPSNQEGDKLERLIKLLRGLEAKDLELFTEMLPRLVEWKGGK